MQAEFNKFVTYTLTPEEEAVGSSFHLLQLAVLHNRRARVAQDIINLTIKEDEGGVQQFLRNRVFLAGQLAFADWLIAVATKDEEGKNKQVLPPQDFEAQFPVA